MILVTKKPFSQLLKGLVFFIASLSYVTYSYAGSYSIQPVRATLSAVQKVDALTVTNQGTEVANIQLELMRWTQDEKGADVFEPTKDILATPPILAIQPNAKQVIRLGLRRPPATDSEQTYRLFLKELPSPPKEGFTGLKVALNMSIPIFVLPNVKLTPQITWRLAVNAQKQLILYSHNQGKSHIQVANFTLKTEEKMLVSAQQVANYMLAQQKRAWPVKDAILNIGDKVQLLAQTDVGEFQADLVVEAE